MNRSNYNSIATAGTAELKDYLSKATYRGFAVALTLMTFAILLLLVQTKLLPPPPILPPTLRIDWIDIDITEHPLIHEPVRSIPQEVVNDVLLGNGDKAGNYVPINDNLFVDDGHEIATFSNQSNSTSTGTTGNNITEAPPETVIAHNPPITAPAEDMIWTEVEVEPSVDLSELQKNVIYPEMALIAKIEEVIVIGVKVSKTGEPILTKVVSGNSTLLIKSAIAAIMKTKFAPAIQNGIPVDCWVSIPINFRIKK
jgi:TonB family protein